MPLIFGRADVRRLRGHDSFMPPLRTLEHITKVMLHRAVRVAAGFLLFLPGLIVAQSQNRPTRRLVTIPIEFKYSDTAFAQRLGLKHSGTAKLTRAHSTEDCITTNAEHLVWVQSYGLALLL